MLNNNNSINDNIKIKIVDEEIHFENGLTRFFPYFFIAIALILFFLLGLGRSVWLALWFCTSWFFDSFHFDAMGVGYIELFSLAYSRYVGSLRWLGIYAV